MIYQSIIPRQLFVPLEINQSGLHISNEAAFNGFLRRIYFEATCVEIREKIKIRTK